jgi:hypothetical protein
MEEMSQNLLDSMTVFVSSNRSVRSCVYGAKLLIDVANSNAANGEVFSTRW